GLEFPYVFIVGMEEHLFPSAAGGLEENLDDLEEERRLCYVGMTRARRKLWLTYAKTRRVWGQEESHPPSRFINEIPRDLIQFSSAVAFESGFLARHARPGQRTLARPADDHHSFPDEDFDQRSQTNNQFTKGAKVKHPTFGTGTIYATEGSGEMMKVSVIFADQSIRKFVLKHARLTRV
ncbi:MAG: ATP-dependent DNA helicase, partial [Bdellovibrionaceae bacterium]|nr:ATP-dependent DNA helicase [Pseudobdellovibrionaceae bacterium]